MGSTSISGCHGKQPMVSYLQSRARLGSGYTLLATKVTGNRHWFKAKRNSDGMTFIGLDILIPGTKSEPDWGYKSLEEADGPGYYDCPISYLKGLPPPVNSSAEEWRKKVAYIHRMNKRTRQEKSALKAGDILQFGGAEYQLTHNLGARGWQVQTPAGETYRMTRAQLHTAVAIKVARADLASARK